MCLKHLGPSFGVLRGPSRPTIEYLPNIFSNNCKGLRNEPWSLCRCVILCDDSSYSHHDSALWMLRCPSCNQTVQWTNPQVCLVLLCYIIYIRLCFPFFKIHLQNSKKYHNNFFIISKWFFAKNGGFSPGSPGRQVGHHRSVAISQALGDLAQLKRGERCLIHAAAGGVGLVAIQYAQHVGAEAGIDPWKQWTFAKPQKYLVCLCMLYIVVLIYTNYKQKGNCKYSGWALDFDDLSHWMTWWMNMYTSL